MNTNCRTCDTQSSIISTNQEKVQKQIQKQVGVHSSMYTMSKGLLNSTINTSNEGVKHDSYQRRLNKLKQKNIQRSMHHHSKNTYEAAYGNKTQPYYIAKCNGNLDEVCNS